ncbi:hypothetical protein FB45DRAFT_1036863 [Roridomyces roridus]|uniref:Uncharacterized protein n=1 Tax=Roridomyces roridus TaxID=1738132 RepID=A0AAD7FDJ3_9AGAR|nr:hypothetical protein FB45DRAFT_1036863 [Roridomyces roridus]
MSPNVRRRHLGTQDDEEVFVHAAKALVQLSRWDEFAWAIIRSDLLEVISDLLSTRWRTFDFCELIGTLAEKEFPIPSILAAIPMEKLVFILDLEHYTGYHTRTSAGVVLKQLSKWREGALAVATVMDMLDRVPTIVATLARYRAIMPTIAGSFTVARLCSHNEQMASGAAEALIELAHCPEGRAALSTTLALFIAPTKPLPASHREAIIRLAQTLPPESPLRSIIPTDRLRQPFDEHPATFWGWAY